MVKRADMGGKLRFIDGDLSTHACVLVWKARTVEMALVVREVRRLVFVASGQQVYDEILCQPGRGIGG